MFPEEKLACRILEQAIKDYTELMKYDIPYIKDKCGVCCSVEELEDFFDGEWCALLLEMTKNKFTGRDIIDKLQKQYA